MGEAYRARDTRLEREIVLKDQPTARTLRMLPRHRICRNTMRTSTANTSPARRTKAISICVEFIKMHLPLVV